MSQFRDALKQHFDENEINISSLSRQCGIDRTTIQHMVGGRKDYKLPSYDALKAVLKCLRMTPGERKYTEELYTIEKIGVHNYVGRQYVKGIIEQIAALHNPDVLRHSVIVSGSVNLDTADCVFTGANAVNSVLQAVFAEEIAVNSNPHICLNVPFSYAYLKQTLLQSYWEQDGRLEIKHLVILSKSPKANQNKNINLETISDILPFAFCLGNGYRAKYYYSSIEAENELLLTMPYYLLTAKRLLLMSGDFTSALLITDVRMIDEYRNAFERSYNQCQNLIEHLDNPLEIFDAYSDCIIDDCPAYSAQGYPCFFQYLSEDIIYRHARMESPNAGETVAGLVTYIANFSRMNITDYFSMNGLEAFARSGRLEVFSEMEANPFTVEDRITILESACSEIEGGGKTRLVDSSKISLSNWAIVSTINNNSLQFYHQNQGVYHYCIIKEASIVNAFVDFFESLSQSDMVFSAEETLSVIRGYIDELRSRGTDIS